MVAKVLSLNTRLKKVCFPQAIVMVLESKGEKTFKMVLQLLKSLSASSVITVDQMRRVRCHLVFESCTAHNYFTKHQLILFTSYCFIYIRSVFIFLRRAMKEFIWTLLKSTSMSLVRTSSWISSLIRASVWESLM